MMSSIIERDKNQGHLVSIQPLAEIGTKEFPWG